MGYMGYSFNSPLSALLHPLLPIGKMTHIAYISPSISIIVLHNGFMGEKAGIKKLGSAHIVFRLPQPFWRF
jgi:hypothetical protein